MAINPFTLIDDGYPEGKGVAELENSFDFNYHLGSDSSYKSLAAEHELEYGVTDDLVLRVAGSYYYEDSRENNGMHFDAFKLEGQYYFSNPNVDPVGVSFLGAITFGEHAMGFEGLAIVQKDWDKWTVAANIGASISMDGVFQKGGDTTTDGALFAGVGATYAVSNTFRIGANISAEMAYGNLNDYGGTTVYVGPCISWVPDEHWWVTGGPSFQLTNEDEPDFICTIKIGYYF